MSNSNQNTMGKISYIVSKNDQKCDIVYRGEYLGIEFMIVDYGTHPCAYIKNPTDDKDIGDGILVHGGITFSGNITDTLLGEVSNSSGMWLGWDYCHGGDYYAQESPLFVFPSDRYAHKYTTEEVYQDVQSAIRQLIACLRRIRNGE